MALAVQNSKGVEYFLHSKEVVLRGNRPRMIFYFAKTARENALDAVPNGYVVSESRNGLPVLKKAA